MSNSTIYVCTEFSAGSHDGPTVAFTVECMAVAHARDTATAFVQKLHDKSGFVVSEAFDAFNVVHLPTATIVHTTKVVPIELRTACAQLEGTKCCG